MSEQKPTIFVAGHRGMVGSAIVRRLQAAGYERIITRTRQELDLLDQRAVEDFFAGHAIDHVYLAAAKVGGIYANNIYPAEFIYDNLVIEANIIHAAYRTGVKRLLFLGSSCVYPKHAEQPMKEEALLTGPLEPTNEPYAIAKIAGIKLCESYNRQYGTDFRCAMPTNLYGPGDNFHPENSHVVPALIRRFHEAGEAGQQEVTIWGSGRARREFLHVDDMADACVHLVNLSASEYYQKLPETITHVNIGTGQDCTIHDLASMIAEITGFQGQLVFDTSKPDGAPRKLLGISRVASLGWQSGIKLRAGLEGTYQWFRAYATDG